MANQDDLDYQAYLDDQEYQKYVQSFNPNQTAQNIQEKERSMVPEALQAKMTPGLKEFSAKLDDTINNHTGQMLASGFPEPISAAKMAARGAGNTLGAVLHPRDALDKLANFLKGVGK